MDVVVGWPQVGAGPTVGRERMKPSLLFKLSTFNFMALEDVVNRRITRTKARNGSLTTWNGIIVVSLETLHGEWFFTFSFYQDWIPKWY